MNKYNYKKGSLREKVINKRTPITYGINVDELFYNCIITHISNTNKKTVKILDVGTGTGIVPRQLYQRSRFVNKPFNIDAIDLSQDLITIAKSLDNKTHYFTDEQDFLHHSRYNIITNRLCPKFNIAKISSLIEENGVYIFKEYDSFRGLKEVREILKDKWVPGKSGSYIVSQLNKYGFKYICYKKFLYQRKYTIFDLDLILKSTNVLRSYVARDYNQIRDTLGTKFLITQDPYIIIASKSRNIFLEN